MKKFIAYVSALVLIIFIAAIGAIVFLSFTVSALVVAVASYGNSIRPSDTGESSAVGLTVSSEGCEPVFNDSLFEDPKTDKKTEIVVGLDRATVYMPIITKISDQI